MKKKQINLFLYLIFLQSFVFSQQRNVNKIIHKSLPEIKKFSTREDIIFKQFQGAVNYNSKLINSDNSNDYLLEFYIYKTKPDEDILSIHAETGIPYDTIVTLNSISSKNENIENRNIILPTVKGLFIAENPVSFLEIIISEENKNSLEKSDFKCYNINDRNFYFYPGKQFSPTQRALFLDNSFKLPLDKIIVSSEYGLRNSPVYNRMKFHKGIDLAAKEGTSVYSCKSGRIKEILNNDSIFGNCIIIEHENGLSSVYAHLSEISVRKNEKINSGKIIGKTGKTGMVTGPHLHFEIREYGKATNPMDFFKNSKQK